VNHKAVHTQVQEGIKLEVIGVPINLANVVGLKNVGEGMLAKEQFLKITK
jgi:hypothetical protein